MNYSWEYQNYPLPSLHPDCDNRLISGSSADIHGAQPSKMGVGGAWPIILLESIVNWQCSVPQKIHCGEHEQILNSSKKSLNAFTKSCISSWYMSLSSSCKSRRKRRRLDQIITLSTEIAHGNSTNMSKIQKWTVLHKWPRRTSPVLIKSVPKY